MPRFRLFVDSTSPLEDAAGPASEQAPAATEPPTDAQALSAFRRALRLEPNDPDYSFILGSALRSLGKHAEAAAVLSEAVALEPSDVSYRVALGAALFGLRLYDTAAEAFGEALRIDPDDPRALGGLGAALTEAGRAEQAVAALERAVSLERSSARLHSNLGVALWRSDRRGEALRALRKAVRLEPGAADVQRNLGLALAERQDLDGAVKCFRRAASNRPADAQCHADLGEALYALGRQREAREAFEQALRLDAHCLEQRPAAQRAREEILSRELRLELEPELQQGRVARLAWAGVLGVVHVLGAIVRPLGASGSAIGLLLLAAGVYAASLLGPPYVRHFLLKDDIAEIGRAPVEDDGHVLERLMHAVRKRGLQDQIQAGSFEIHTRAAWRSIRCDYEVPLRLLPGLEHRLRLQVEVEEPFVLASRP